MTHELHVLQEARRFVDTTDQSPCNGCDACGVRCIEGVPMLRPEFEAIRQYVDSEAGAEARALGLVPRETPYPGTEDDPEVAATYLVCRFRDAERGRCTIYPVRPTVCRLFGHVGWLPCPIEKVPVTPGGWEAMRRYSQAPQHTYEEWLAWEDAEG